MIRILTIELKLEKETMLGLLQEHSSDGHPFTRSVSGITSRGFEKTYDQVRADSRGYKALSCVLPEIFVASTFAGIHWELTIIPYMNTGPTTKIISKINR